MTPEKQQIAIAEACGWTNVHPVIIKNVTKQGDDRFCGITSDKGWIPNYLFDLNAMHEAIITKFITEDEQNNFVINLMDILQINESGYWQNKEVWAMSTATCVPLAKAFLKTLNLWTDYTNYSPPAHPTLQPRRRVVGLRLCLAQIRRVFQLASRRPRFGPLVVRPPGVCERGRNGIRDKNIY